MISIKPFKALLYSQDKIRDFSEVVCPPYDVISPTQQDYFHKLNPYNFIHLLLGKDIPDENKYKRAGILFSDWIKNKIFIQDDKPSIYFYSQQYNIKGETKTRLGFIALLGLGGKDSSVFGHEHTRLEAKEDRFKLIKKVHANLSPIFIVSKDKKRIIQRVFDLYIQGTLPIIEVKDKDNTLHKLWRIDSPQVLEMIQSGMQKEDAFIADGHHRYEVSLAYRDFMKEKYPDRFKEDSSLNYTLAYFTNTDLRGLSILPIHRLLKLDKTLDLNKFILRLKEHFDVEEIKDKTRFFFLMQKGGRAEHLLGMYKDRRFYLLRLKNIRILDKLIADKPKEYRTLDVSMLNHIIFKDILGYDSMSKNSLKYSPSAEEFITLADSDPLNIAFFLNPVKMQQIIDVALNGNKMPAKSTYFYPKVLSGLVINKHEEL
ncbi:MAG: DUF1015 domain-containing protein [Candidatus Omnitrophica bacterium]|nr:DUF1015 domain-containing protein [Candidatus Omnitrophota bacterium]